MTIDLELLEIALNSRESWYKKNGGGWPTDEHARIYLAALAFQSKPVENADDIRRALHWIKTEPNAPKHFTKDGNEKCRKTIRALLMERVGNAEN